MDKWFCPLFRLMITVLYSQSSPVSTRDVAMLPLKDGSLCVSHWLISGASHCVGADESTSVPAACYH